MAKLSDGYDEAMEAMQEVGEEENMKLEQRLSYIALIAQIGPMFGLLGTVDGMVVAFDVIAAQQRHAQAVRVGPGHRHGAGHHGRRPVDRHPGDRLLPHHPQPLPELVLEVGMVSEDLMKRFAGTAGRRRPRRHAAGTVPFASNRSNTMKLSKSSGYPKRQRST